MRNSPGTFAIAALAVSTTFALFAATLETLAGPDLSARAGVEPGPTRAAMSIAQDVRRG